MHEEAGLLGSTRHLPDKKNNCKGSAKNNEPFGRPSNVREREPLS